MSAYRLIIYKVEKVTTRLWVAGDRERSYIISTNIEYVILRIKDSKKLVWYLKRKIRKKENKYSFNSQMFMATFTKNVDIFHIHIS